jgi:hypothetical protein
MAGLSRAARGAAKPTRTLDLIGGSLSAVLVGLEFEG